MMRYYKRNNPVVDMTYYEIVAQTHNIIFLRQRGLISNSVYKETFPISKEKFKIDYMDDSVYRKYQF
jgi:hypothetical protein